MSLATAIGYEHKTPNPFQRWVQRVGSSRGGSAALSKTLRRFDTVALKLSGGQMTVVELMAGIPSFALTTNGARSGQPRATHLIGFPHRGGIAIIGSNWGGATTPSWVFNLEAMPEATLEYRGRSVPVITRLADSAEADEVFAVAKRVYPGYSLYRERAVHREIKVFVLASADG